ncbi:hypothetical protein BXZ70DRAFT_874163, partial [Cristinia sonorae]
CVACQEPIRGYELKAPCNHYYDKVCVLALFEASIRDESLYPPRCCQRRIPVHHAKHLMSDKAWAHFTRKGREYTTLHRIYCSNVKCGQFLGPQSETPEFFHCSAKGCGTSTCAKCKVSVPLPILHRCLPKTQEEDKAVLDLADREGWSRCPGCAQLIELNLGCYHMTCRCKTE